MGTLIRAATGLWLALLLMGQAPRWDNAAEIRADIAATHPSKRLSHEFHLGWLRLKEEFTPQNGTKPSRKSGLFQAHTLQSAL